MEWITDEFPPIAEGLRNVSIEVEAHLERLSQPSTPDWMAAGIWQRADIQESRRK